MNPSDIYPPIEQTQRTRGGGGMFVKDEDVNEERIGNAGLRHLTEGVKTIGSRLGLFGAFPREPASR